MAWRVHLGSLHDSRRREGSWSWSAVPTEKGVDGQTSQAGRLVGSLEPYAIWFVEDPMLAAGHAWFRDVHMSGMCCRTVIFAQILL